MDTTGWPGDGVLPGALAELFVLSASPFIVGIAAGAQLAVSTFSMGG